MSSNISEVDNSFIGIIHQATQEIGSKEGRRYLVISEGKLGFSNDKDHETRFKRLIEFVTEKLKGLTLTEGENDSGHDRLREDSSDICFLRELSDSKSCDPKIDGLFVSKGYNKFYKSLPHLGECNRRRSSCLEKGILFWQTRLGKIRQNRRGAPTPG